MGLRVVKQHITLAHGFVVDVMMWYLFAHVSAPSCSWPIRTLREVPHRGLRQLMLAIIFARWQDPATLRELLAQADAELLQHGGPSVP